MPFLIWHLIRHHRIAVIRNGRQFDKLLNKSFTSGRIEVIDWNSIDYHLRHRIDAEAIKMVEQQFDPWFKHSRLSRLIRIMFETVDAEMALKKSMIIQLKSVAQTLLIIDQLAGNSGRKKDLLFVPSEIGRAHV